MITKHLTQNVSETHNINNHTQGAQCGVKNKPLDKQRLGETRPLLR